MTTPPNDSQLLATVRPYLAAIVRGDGEAVAQFYHPDIMQEEFPNRLVASGVTRDLATLRASFERGKSVITAQTYDVLNVLEVGDQIVLELAWTGTLAMTISEQLPAGYVMRVRFAQFFEFRYGQIYRIRNYDCFEPW